MAGKREENKEERGKEEGKQEGKRVGGRNYRKRKGKEIRKDYFLFHSHYHSPKSRT